MCQICFVESEKLLPKWYLKSSSCCPFFWPKIHSVPPWDTPALRATEREYGDPPMTRIPNSEVVEEELARIVFEVVEVEFDEVG